MTTYKITGGRLARCGLITGLASVLAACGGDGGSSAPTTPPPPAANRAPTVTLTNVPTEIREADALSFDISGSDPDGDALTFTLATTAGPELSLSVSGTTGMGSAPAVDADTTATIQVTASDGRASATATADITILNNAAPTAILTTGATTVREGEVITVDASTSSDEEGDVLTYRYTITSGPDIDLSGQTGSMASFTAPDVDTDIVLTVDVSVDDGRDVAVETVDINILNNNAPVASLVATPDDVDEGVDVTFDASASTDAEGDPLTFTYIQIAGPALNLDGAGETFTTEAPEVDTDRVVTLEVQVSDGRDVSSQRVDINLRNVEQTPAFPVTFEIDKSLSVDGELFAIDDVLNPGSQGLIAVSESDAGPVGLRAVRVNASADFIEGSTPLISPQFERGLQLEEGRFGLYFLTESDGITFLQLDTSNTSAANFSITGKLDVDAACAVEMVSAGFSSAGGVIIIGRKGGVDLYSYSLAEAENGFLEPDFTSLTLQSSINDGHDYCALTLPRALIASGRNSSATDFLAIRAEDFSIQGFEIRDNEAGILTLTPTFRIAETGLDPNTQSFVKGLEEINSFGTTAIIVSDGMREGKHSLLYIFDQSDSRTRPMVEDILIRTGHWSLGVPTDLAVRRFDEGFESYLIVATPGTPQAVAFPRPFFGDPSVPLDATYLEVGLGAALVYATRSVSGSNRDNAFNGLIFGYPEKGEIRRFDETDPPE
ncbi:hypothetical protein [Litorimonas sp. WD9-15]|uniref:hypothetical protein n=1 Tax=Litorimonas sp. WD9-15 TaxID=3418716 RepID=UPI003CFDA81E